MLSHPLTVFEMQMYYKKEPKFNGVYSRNNLSKIKDQVYVVNLDEYESIGTHLYVNANDIVYFDSFGVEHIPKEIKKFIRNKNITNIYRIHACDSIMCGYFCIGFIEFVLKDKTLLDYAKLFSPNDYGNYDKIILQ